MDTQSSEQVLCDRLLLKTSIEAVKLLAKLGLPFRGHDEFFHPGNFIELIRFMGKVNAEIPGSDKYTSAMAQEEILNIFANKVRNKIREEVGDAKFCIIIDEVFVEAYEAQLVITLRYVDRDGFVRERFFEVVRVDEDDTTFLTLKKEITNVLTRNNLSVENMRGQGFDGASNMRNAWNKLQTLFLRDCPYAYYVHCFAHKLEPALVAASKSVRDVWQFFSKLTSIVKLVSASPESHSKFKSAREVEIANMVAFKELGIGMTPWSSQFNSVSRLIYMFSEISTVLENMIQNGLNNNIRGEAKYVYEEMKSFEFVCLVFV